MKSFIFLMLTVCCSGVFAQRNTGTPTSNISSMGSTSLTGGNDAFTYGQGIDLNSFKNNDVSGSPFLKKDFTSAFVAFKGGKKFNNVLVKFDILHNEIDIEKNETLLSLQDLDSISYPDSIYQNMTLKTGYPSINEHDISSIYQIVAQNNEIQFLKYYRCHMSTTRSLGFPDKTSFDVDDQYYLFNKSTKTIRQIKLNKKSFSSAIADMGYSKAEIDNDKDIDFKNEKEVAYLISSVNF